MDGLDQHHRRRDLGHSNLGHLVTDEEIAQEGGYKPFMQEHLTGLNGHVQFIHTKYLLIDPLTDHPVVVTGSANFSEPSTDENDDNMLWIAGDQRVVAGDAGSVKHLREDFAWSAPFFVAGSTKDRERRLFSGRLAG